MGSGYVLRAGRGGGDGEGQMVGSIWGERGKAIACGGDWRGPSGGMAASVRKRQAWLRRGEKDSEGVGEKRQELTWTVRGVQSPDRG